MRTRTAIVAVLLGGASAVSTTCLAAEPAPAAVIAPNTGRTMCSALTAEDFTRAGVKVKKLLDADGDADGDTDNDSAYCVYDADLAHHVEFDIFYPAGDTPEPEAAEPDYEGAGAENSELEQQG